MDCEWTKSHVLGATKNNPRKRKQKSEPGAVIGLHVLNSNKQTISSSEKISPNSFRNSSPKEKLDLL